MGWGEGQERAVTTPWFSWQDALIYSILLYPEHSVQDKSAGQTQDAQSQLMRTGEPRPQISGKEVPLLCSDPAVGPPYQLTHLRDHLVPPVLLGAPAAPITVLLQMAPEC